MSTRNRMPPGGTSKVWDGVTLSRRAFLRATGAAGLGIAAAHFVPGVPGDHPSLESTAAAAAPADPVADLAAALEYDAERIFRFVSDEIRYEPYGGVLRGARGTLASRAGNSADQATLLAALLRTSLLPVRFAVGELDGDVAERLLADAEADVDSVMQHGLDALAGVVPGGGPVTVQLTPDQQSQLDEAAANRERIGTWARGRLERTTDMITTALEDVGVELPGGLTAVPDSERSRHIWVQVAATADWRDLDPTIPGASPGDVLASARETLDDLPDEMAHEVELTFISETLVGDALSERRLLSYRERADILAGLPMAVTNTHPDALTALGVSIAGSLSGGGAYVPLIIVGEDAVVGATPIHLSAQADAAESAGEGGAFLDLAPGSDETTAEWVELTIHSPEAEPVVVRRAIFDRLGPARRSAGGISLADLAPVERIDIPDGPQEQAVPALTTHWLTVSTGLPSRHDAVLGVDPGEDSRAGALMSEAYHLVAAGVNLEYAVPGGVRPFIDAPNVAAYSLAMRSARDGDVIAESAVDIWHRSHGVAAVKGITPGPAPSVVAGVLAHVAERLVGGEVGVVPSAQGGTGFVSVGAIFDAAEAAGIPWRVLRGTGATSELPWSDDARERLERSLAEGWIAIAPGQPLIIDEQERIGWWLIHPRSGRTIDELDDGRGGALADYLTTLRVWYESLPAWIRLGVCIATLARGMLAILNLAMTVAEGRSLTGGWSIASMGSAATAPISYRLAGC